jgi:hypothetical protein
MYLFLLLVFQITTSLPQDFKKEDNAMDSEANSTAASSSICKGPVDHKLPTLPTDEELLVYCITEFYVELDRNSEAADRLLEKVPVTNLKS